MDPHAAWAQAQEAEKRHWLTAGFTPERILRDQTIKAKATREWLALWLTFGPETRILQLGCAITGRIHRLPGRRCAIDPLADFFRETWPDLIDPEVDYRTGKGEELPWGNAAFDLVLCSNTLDHCEDPSRVAREMLRVTAPDGGLILLSGHVFGRLGAALHASPLGRWLDRSHPHSFTLGALDRMFVPPDPSVQVTAIDRKSRRVRVRSGGWTGAAKRLTVALGLGPRFAELVLMLQRTR